MTAADLLQTSPGRSGITQVDLAATILGRSEAEVLGVFRDAEEVETSGWKIRLLRERNWISFSEPTSDAAMSGSVDYDPEVVGREARRLIEIAEDEGLELTATDAVARILEKRGTGR